MDPQVYAQVMQTTEQLYSTIQNLDWQLSCAKHLLKKYKDLSIAQQLHINAQSVKLAVAKVTRENLKAKSDDLQA